MTDPTPAPEPTTNGETPSGSRPDGNGEVPVNGRPMEVSPIFEAAVQRAIAGANQPLPEEMTVTQAADFLDVSREFILKLIRRGELPCHRAGKRRRIPSAALLEQNEKMYQQAKKAAEEITRISQELGLYESDPPDK